MDVMRLILGFFRAFLLSRAALVAEECAGPRESCAVLYLL